MLVAGWPVTHKIDCSINQQPAGRLVEPAAGIGKWLVVCQLINRDRLGIIPQMYSFLRKFFSRFRVGIFRTFRKNFCVCMVMTGCIEIRSNDENLIIAKRPDIRNQQLVEPAAGKRTAGCLLINHLLFF